MPVHSCSACGTSYPDTPEPPRHCRICDDERQYVPPNGQAWTTPETLGRGRVGTRLRTFPSRLPMLRLDRFYATPNGIMVKAWTDREARALFGSSAGAGGCRIRLAQRHRRPDDRFVILGPGRGLRGWRRW